MAQLNYTGAVAKLLEIGKPANSIEPNKWPDYPKEFQLEQADIWGLLRMALDEDLYSIEYNEKNPEPALWAPTHALRALGQLKATEVIEPLSKLFDLDDDYTVETLPIVYGLLGLTAIPTLNELLQECITDEFSFKASNVIQALVDIGKSHPEGKDEVAGILTNFLENYAEYDVEINGYLISALTDLKAENALPLIKEAFEAKEVQEFIIRWHSVQLAFGLITQEEHDRIDEEYKAARRAKFDHTNQQLFNSDSPFSGQSLSPAQKKQKEKAKAKRKMAKASQKKNRKK